MNMLDKFTTIKLNMLSPLHETVDAVDNPITVRDCELSMCFQSFSTNAAHIHIERDPVAAAVVVVGVVVVP